MSLGTHPATRSRSSPPSTTATCSSPSPITGALPPRRIRTAVTSGSIGMSERARALGGSLDAGTTVDGWRVDARLPILAAPSNEFVPS